MSMKMFEKTVGKASIGKSCGENYWIKNRENNDYPQILYLPSVVSFAKSFEFKLKDSDDKNECDRIEERIFFLSPINIFIRKVSDFPEKPTNKFRMSFHFIFTWQSNWCVCVCVCVLAECCKDAKFMGNIFFCTTS